MRFTTYRTWAKNKAQGKQTKELKALKTLYHVTQQFTKYHDSLQTMLQEVLNATKVLTKANMANIQLLDQQKRIRRTTVFYGFQEGFQDQSIHASESRGACGRVHQTGLRVVVEDVATSPIFTGTPDMDFMNQHGIVSLQSTPLISTSGNFVGILSTYYTSSHLFRTAELRNLDFLAVQAADAIERTLAKEALRQSEARALALVEELKTLDQNKNQFLGVLSHELRNPLACIMMSLSLLMQTAAKETQEIEILTTMTRQAHQLKYLVDDLMDMSRITRNLIHLRQESVELNELLSKAVEDVQEQFRNNQVRFTMEKSPYPIRVAADPTRFTQVIANLLDNALKFTAPGDYTKVILHNDSVKKEAVVEVGDSGKGINEELLQDVFQPFVQADTTLDRSRGGLGLGLYVAKGIVELHGGTLEAASSGLGQGATFTIRLPLLLEEEKENVPANNQEEWMRRPLKVLVIDDMKHVAEVICATLKALGHEAISAYRGVDGIRKALEYQPEVIICDIGLPDVDGYEVARTIRQQQTRRDLHLIALSGYSRPEDAKKALQVGFDCHLAKPVDIRALERTLWQVVQG